MNSNKVVKSIGAALALIIALGLAPVERAHQRQGRTSTEDGTERI